jgi:hypothetical protein
MRRVYISKRICAVAMALVIVVSGATLYAFNVMRSKNRRPDLQLPQAYEQALDALGAETNSFYCLRADALSMSDSPGSTEWRPGFVEWHFLFYATNGQFRELIVPSSGKVIKRDKPRDSY